MQTMPHSFAIIPAAGHSVRMGRPKLLLDLAGKPLMRHTLEAWLASRVTAVVVVVRLDDEPLAAAVRGVAEEFADPRLSLVRPETPPPDMKASVQTALRHIERTFQPKGNDAFLVAPADMPALSPAIVDALLERHLAGNRTEKGRILVPELGGRQGHPVLFPWPFAAAVHELPGDAGLNELAHRHPPHCIACDHLSPASADAFADVDTPEQYRRLVGE